MPRLSNFLACGLFSAAACLGPALSAGAQTSEHPFARVNDAPRARPAPAAARWRGLLGEYGADSTVACTLERDGNLWVLSDWRDTMRLRQAGADSFVVAGGAHAGAPATFHQDATGRATELTLDGSTFPRRDIEPRAGTNQLRVTPLRPVDELRREALAATPPHETGTFRPFDLVELVRLDSTIKLEIRYATTNNFLGSRMYEEARAFMQRPAAEALVRVNRALAPLGYGLLVHDAYRPWYVTKIFYDATPADKKWLVANPATGSLHNRGSAVDLTLYDRRTGRAVDMPSTYDESTDRAFAFYPCGTSLERWHRALLRRVMESEGFTVNPTEWWHFDYKDWRDYPIGNIPFRMIGTSHR